jgi:chromosome segregation ATPase
MTDAKRLEASLQSLRSEIDALAIGDAEARQRLETLIGQLEQAIERRDSRGGGDKTVGEQLRVSILKLEAAHPRLAGVLNEVMESLGSMGI